MLFEYTFPVGQLATHSPTDPLDLRKNCVAVHTVLQHILYPVTGCIASNVKFPVQDVHVFREPLTEY